MYIFDWLAGQILANWELTLRYLLLDAKEHEIPVIIRITLLFVLMLQAASAAAQEDALAEQAAITETQSSDAAKAN